MWKYYGQERPAFALQPESGQESVWDYPRPPKVVACNRTVEVIHDNRVIAHSIETYRVLETASPPTFYIPKKDIDWSQLRELPGHSFCEWKGLASYWALASQPAGLPVAWWYADPNPDFEMLREHTAFYPGRITCFVDKERVRPQPGKFYGGWITNDIVGPCKGEPGTEHW
jgi:uncharacterized protein (DUF427 family)